MSLLVTKFEKRDPLTGENSLTMDDLETEFMIELARMQNESQTLTLQDLTIIKDMLSYIYR